MAFDITTYRLGPFLLRSEVPIPELTEMEDRGEGNVFIRYGTVPEKIDGVVANETKWWASKDEYLQRVPGVANFLVSRGREVIVEPAAGSHPLDVRAYLLSPIFTVLFHQAGMYSLHASAIRTPIGVVAFAGHSGYGKSTIAAYLQQRGYQVISDDLCLLDPDCATGGGRPLVVPVVPSLKLWGSAVEQLGVPLSSLTKMFSLEEKYRIPIAEVEERLPLRELMFLEWAKDAEEPASITPLDGAKAIAKIMDVTHCDHLMKPMDRKAENFLLAGRILSHVPAFIFRRPRDFSQSEQATDVMVEHLSLLA